MHGKCNSTHALSPSSINLGSYFDCEAGFESLSRSWLVDDFTFQSRFFSPLFSRFVSFIGFRYLHIPIIFILSLGFSALGMKSGQRSWLRSRKTYRVRRSDSRVRTVHDVDPWEICLYEHKALADFVPSELAWGNIAIGVYPCASNSPCSLFMSPCYPTITLFPSRSRRNRLHNDHEITLQSLKYMN